MASRIDQETDQPLTVQLSIVVPVYNEAGRIAATLDAIITWLAANRIDAELLIVDDGSTDHTVSVVQALADALPYLHLTSIPHGGKARAVLHGLRQAKGNVVGFMDADLATPLSTLTPALDAIHDGADMVIASREGEGSVRIAEPWYRHAMGRVFNGIVRLTLLPGIQDTQCGFKFMTRDARDRILPRVRLYAVQHSVDEARVTAFDVELLYIARALGMSISIIPVTWTYGNHSKVNPVRDTLQNLSDVLQVWINGRRGRYVP